MKIGILASGSGDSIEVAIKQVKALYPDVVFFGFSDRSCGVFDLFNIHCENTCMYLSENVEDISSAAYCFFARNECEIVLLSYTRLISSSLYSYISCFNIHPSLLPAHKGFGAVQSAFDQQDSRIGVTIHKVDSSVDGGEIVCQVETNPSTMNIKYWHSLVYVMKGLLLSTFIADAHETKPDRSISSFDFSPYIPEMFTLVGIKTDKHIISGLLKTARTSIASSICTSTK